MPWARIGSRGVGKLSGCLQPHLSQHIPEKVCMYLSIRLDEGLLGSVVQVCYHERSGLIRLANYVYPSLTFIMSMWNSVKAKVGKSTFIPFHIYHIRVKRFSFGNQPDKMGALSSTDPTQPFCSAAAYNATEEGSTSESLSS